VRTLINIIIITSDCKIKAKSKTLIKALDKIFNKILDNSLDETAVDQKIVSLSKSMITAEKIISVLNMITQIIQLKTALCRLSFNSNQVSVKDDKIKSQSFKM